ncbi:hypothetical protein GCK72_008878 [Caenorhabditis remanei]|uniref:Sdz-33 F-box domain-containing protein n=1 Tax=Caenorhabditis remanei TaxID=31234 RepID=A0A6A5H0V2_CAERE|nr:hypothetical protein GCK72_008878 [Caenorhabditis remanei]KAF1760629.1 hypothetical protein GCK72_008878 [Caenorhabditis remanei]
MNLSTCSKRSKWISSAYTMPELNISIELYKDTSRALHLKSIIYVNEVRKGGISHWLHVVPTYIKKNFGKVFQISEFEWKFYHDPSVNLTEILATRLSGFYGWNSLRFVIFRKDIEQSDLEKFPVLLSCVEGIIIRKKRVKREDLDTLFMNRRNIQSFNIEGRYPVGYDNYGIWCARIMVLLHAPQNIEDILRMDCEKIGCAVTRYKNSDVNRFLKRWLQSTNGENHKYLKREIRLCNVENDSNMLEDLPVTPWNPKQRGQFYYCQNSHFNPAIDCSKGFDLLREDGVLATVMPGEGEFIFNIWNERFPDIPKDDFPSNSVFY